MQERHEEYQSDPWVRKEEEEMAIHFSILAWKIPQIEEPRRLQSMGARRVGHDWATEHSMQQITASWEKLPVEEMTWPDIFMIAP